FCNQCGWKNPPGSRFCSRCGSRLQDSSALVIDPPVKQAARPKSSNGHAALAGNEEAGPKIEDSDQSLSRYVGVVIGLAVLLVVALYVITIISKQNPVGATGSASIVQMPAEARSAAVIEAHESIPIDERFAPRVDSLLTAIERADGEEERALQNQLIDYLLSIGRVDLAAIRQQRIAVRSDTEADWRRAGDLHYEWLEAVGQERKTDVALLAIDAYRRVLDRNPDDVDVRARLGWVYQFDPANPMEAIRQTNMVLEHDPDHLAANYNRAVFLLRINRLDDAAAQFRRVMELAGSDSPYYRQADVWLKDIEGQRQTGGRPQGCSAKRQRRQRNDPASECQKDGGKELFSVSDKERIREAVARAEENTSGE